MFSLGASRLLLTRPGNRFAEASRPTLAALYYQHATAAIAAARPARHALDGAPRRPGQRHVLSAEPLRGGADGAG